ncbi:CUE domain-containing protein 1-like [Liolophura sinensis]|uniref:CUE domain-containing protein 1-like n=1 Tax=Liolophura sinensis TaxID=3198878 RepID=UPI0031589036
MATRSENDYMPNNMASKKSESRPTRQLDFYQAMADFQHMFPTMDEEIIEAVLRANNGAVDATIDQLLTMNIDNEEETDGPEAVDGLTHRTRSKGKARLSSETKSKSLSCEDPPSYSEAIRHQPPVQAKRAPSSGKAGRLAARGRQHTAPNLLDLDIGTFASTLATVSSERTDPKTLLGNQALENGSPRRQRTWHPPLLGKLPDDFLRLKPEGPSHRSSRPLGRSQSMPAQQRPPLQCLVRHEISSSLLQKKLRENERRRRSTPSRGDPEMTQYLEDERMAIMLQNSEFLEELRQNEDFMKTLERDRLNASAFEPTPSTPPSSRQPVRSLSTASSSTSTPTPLPTPKEMAPLPPIPDDKIEDFQEGYGQDRQDTLEAFPFTQKLNNGAEDADRELRRQLKHMGKASKRQFADLARRFFSRRKKKSSRQLLRDSHAPSTANLLEEEDDDDVLEERGEDIHVRGYRDDMQTPPSSQLVVPSYKTVQRPAYNPDMNVKYFDSTPTDMV